MYDCRACKHYVEFKDPFNYAAEGYPDGVTVFGVCYKNCRNHICYPVYIPDGGVCKDFTKRPKAKVSSEDLLQLEIDDLLSGKRMECNR